MEIKTFKCDLCEEIFQEETYYICNIAYPDWVKTVEIHVEDVCPTCFRKIRKTLLGLMSDEMRKKHLGGQK